MLIGIDGSHANKEQRTGVEEYCWQIIQALKKIIPSDMRVVLYSNKTLLPPLNDLPANWQVKILNWPFRKLWSQTRLAYELWKNSPAVYFSPGQLLPWLMPRRTVVMVHDSAFVAHPRAYKFFGRLYLRLMNWWIVKRATKIITSTFFNRAELIRYYGIEVADKTEIIPLAFNKNLYNVSAEQFSSATLEQGWGISKPFVLFIGRLETKKNVARLVEAFEKIKIQLDWQLILVGKPGCGHNTIKQKINSSAYKNDIKILNWVDTADLHGLLRAAQLLAFVSLYEGFGLPLLEAMACGCPVVAADIEALKEVGQECALYADPANSQDIAEKIMSLQIDSVLRARLINCGLERVKSFNWEETAKQTWDCLNSVAGKP